MFAITGGHMVPTHNIGLNSVKDELTALFISRNTLSPKMFGVPSQLSNPLEALMQSCGLGYLGEGEIKTT